MACNYLARKLVSKTNLNIGKYVWLAILWSERLQNQTNLILQNKHGLQSLARKLAKQSKPEYCKTRTMACNPLTRKRAANKNLQSVNQAWFAKLCPEKLQQLENLNIAKQTWLASLWPGSLQTQTNPEYCKMKLAIIGYESLHQRTRPNNAK